MMTPTNPGHSVTKNTNINQKMFILEIVGGVLFILLILLCLLLHFFRKKCLKPRKLFKKLWLSSTFRRAKMDQSSSTSWVNLVVSQCESEFSDGNRLPESSDHQEVVMVDVHMDPECAVEEADMHTPAPQHTYRASQAFSPREKSLSRKKNDCSRMSLESMASFFINSIHSLEKTEGYDFPDKEDNRHSFSARSLFEEEGQAMFQVELSRPHSQQQMHPQHLAAQAISQQHLQEAGTSDWKSQHVVMSESVSIPASLSEELLINKGLTEVGRQQPLPHPRSWFVFLDGHANTVRHSHNDLQTDGRKEINNLSLDYGNDINEPEEKGQMYPQKDLDEVDQSGSECGSAVCSPEDNIQRRMLEGGRRRRDGQLPSLQEKTIKRSVENPSEPSADCDSDDGNHPRKDKKSPWQKREERPVLRFNLK